MISSATVLLKRDLRELCPLGKLCPVSLALRAYRKLTLKPSSSRRWLVVVHISTVESPYSGAS